MNGKVRGKNRQTRNGNRLLVIALAGFILLLLLSASIKAGPRAAKAAATAAAEPPSGKLVFLLTTGIEDIHEMDLCLDYATTAKKSGRLAEVAILADGRGVEAFASRMGARPTEMGNLARQAQAAGVRMIVSADGLKQGGIAASELSPEPNEVVPDGAAKLAEMIGQGYEVIHF